MTKKDYFETEFPEVEVEIEEAERPQFTIKDTKKLTLFYLLGSMLLFPFIGAILAAITVALQGKPLTETVIMSYTMFFSELMVTYVLIKMTFNILKYDLIVFKNNLVQNFGKVGINYIMAFGVSFLLQIVYNFIGISQSVNQDAVVEMTLAAPILMIITTVIFAPLSEEIIFRGGLYKGFLSVMSERNATILSSFLFGAVHLLAGIKNPLELLFIFQYASMGYFMLKSYRDTDSIWGAILYHFVNNFLAVVMVIYG